jgi:hypothetical protein
VILKKKSTKVTVTFLFHPKIVAQNKKGVFLLTPHDIENILSFSMAYCKGPTSCCSSRYVAARQHTHILLASYR